MYVGSAKRRGAHSARSNRFQSFLDAIDGCHVLRRAFDASRSVELQYLARSQQPVKGSFRGSKYLEASSMCVKEFVNSFVACEPFLVNGPQPLWNLGSGHDEVGGRVMALQQRCCYLGSSHRGESPLIARRVELYQIRV